MKSSWLPILNTGDWNDTIVNLFSELKLYEEIFLKACKSCDNYGTDIYFLQIYLFYSNDHNLFYE